MVAAMGDRRLRRELSIIALICTLGIFLLPCASGSYTSIHGPVTALRAIRIATDVVQSFQLNPSRPVGTGPKLVRERRLATRTPSPKILDAPGELILRC
jgi:hypothetical protein